MFIGAMGSREEVIPMGIRRSPTWRMTIRRLARRATVALTASSFASQSGRIWSVNKEIRKRSEVGPLVGPLQYDGAL